MEEEKLITKMEWNFKEIDENVKSNIEIFTSIFPLPKISKNQWKKLVADNEIVISSSPSDRHDHSIYKSEKSKHKKESKSILDNDQNDHQIELFDEDNKKGFPIGDFCDESLPDLSSLPSGEISSKDHENYSIVPPPDSNFSADQTNVISHLQIHSPSFSSLFLPSSLFHSLVCFFFLIFF